MVVVVVVVDGVEGGGCRSIYIIINRKEIYLIPWPKDSLFPLRLI